MMNTASNYKTESVQNIYPAQITLNHNARKREVDRINRENMVSTNHYVKKVPLRIC